MKPTFDFSKIKYPIVAQIAIGLVCGLLDFFVGNSFVGLENFPIFLDSIFTIAVSMFSVWGGIIAGLFMQILDKLFSTFPGSLAFSVCSFSIVILVRLFVHVGKKWNYLCTGVILVAALTIVISLEGGLINAILYVKFGYKDPETIGNIVTSLILDGYPYFLSSVMARIPVNLLDKTISCILGWIFARLFVKVLPPPQKKIDEEEPDQ